MSDNPEARELLSLALQDRDFDGLCNPDADCGCGLDDPMPCSEFYGDCVAAFKWRCETEDGPCKAIASQEGCEFEDLGGGCYQTRRQDP